MKNGKCIGLMLMAVGLLVGGAACADTSERDKRATVAFGAYPVAEFPEASHDVAGLRLNLLAGRHRNVAGVDMGVLANICDGSFSGIEFAAVCNVVGDSAWSAQFATVCNYSSNYARGVQLALVNLSDEDFAGIQLGCCNFVGDFGGLQTGLFNSAESGVGVQFGLVNVSGGFTGVQLGLLNINLSSGVPVLPVMNVKL